MVMKAFEFMQKQKDLMPKNPKLGQIYYEPYMRQMRVWNGKMWRETTASEMTDGVKKYGSTLKWMEAETKGKCS